MRIVAGFFATRKKLVRAEFPMMAVVERQTMSIGRSGEATDRVMKITDALNQVTEFTYDPANGNLRTVKEPLNQVTTTGYNNVGQWFFSWEKHRTPITRIAKNAQNRLSA